MRHSRLSLAVSTSQLTRLALAFALFFGVQLAASAQTYKVIYAFQGSTDGYDPQGGLIADKAGNLYGTVFGGTTGFGAVFQLAPPTVSGGAWTETTVYAFTDGADGGGPIGDLAMDAAGNIYGTAQVGGSSGTGVVFELSPPAIQGGAWTETVLYNGDLPSGGVALDRAGNLYGTNEAGGVDFSICDGFQITGCGSAFELSPPAVSGGSWTATDLYDFGTSGQTDALSPRYNVAVSRGGALYGVASSGLYGQGAVYKLTPPTTSGNPWTETIIHNFKGGTGDGGGPLGDVIIGKGGVLYGTTLTGGTGLNGFDGTVYQITPPAPGAGWKESVIYNFTGGKDGALPEAGLVLDSLGNLYGTTYSDGAKCRVSTTCGSVFKLAPPSTSGGTWTETTLHDFLGNDGANPAAPLLLLNGTLYGTTTKGGTTTGNGYGVVFQVTP